MTQPGPALAGPGLPPTPFLHSRAPPSPAPSSQPSALAQAGKLPGSVKYS